MSVSDAEDARAVVAHLAQHIRETFPDLGLATDATPADVCAVIRALLAELKGRRIIGVWA